MILFKRTMNFSLVDLSFNSEVFYEFFAWITPHRYDMSHLISEWILTMIFHAGAGWKMKRTATVRLRISTIFCVRQRKGVLHQDAYENERNPSCHVPFYPSGFLYYTLFFLQFWNVFDLVLPFDHLWRKSPLKGTILPVYSKYTSQKFLYSLRHRLSSLWIRNVRGFLHASYIVSSRFQLHSVNTIALTDIICVKYKANKIVNKNWYI